MAGLKTLKARRDRLRSRRLLPLLRRSKKREMAFPLSVYCPVPFPSLSSFYVRRAGYKYVFIEGSL